MLSSLYEQLRTASNTKKVANFRAFKKINKVAVVVIDSLLLLI